MNREPIGIVAGSGLAGLAERMVVERELAFPEAGLPAPGVAGHAGRLLFGTLGSAEVVVMQGRVHLYEGRSAQQVAAGVAFLHRHGVRRLVLTNAGGSLNPEFPPGQWMMLADHLNLTGTSPLEGSNRFLDLTAVYDAGWREEFRRAAAAAGMPLPEGVYAGLRGPQYETPAEVRMLRVLGADAVGMSTVLEAIQARALGLRVAGFSCLTNWAAGLGGRELDHAEVVETGARAGREMARLLELVLG
jgi:purine-nucleoside phosphorylase